MIKETVLVLVCLSCAVSALMPGGLFPMDLTDEKELDNLNNLTTYGANMIAERRMQENKKKFASDKDKVLKYSSRVVSAQKQIVGGVMYHLVVRINNARCSRNCAVEECKMKIWERVWENFRNLTEYSCSNIIEPAVKGGWKEINPAQAKSLKSLENLVSHINKASNSLFHQSLVSLKTARRQIVSGAKYQFEFSLAETNCNKSEKKANLKECLVANDAKTITCTGSVVEQLWMPVPYSGHTFKC